MSDGNVAQFPQRRPQPFQVIYPTNWEGQEPQPVRWLVKNCIPRGTVCLFSGDSGLGKSLLSQQLQTCAALNKPWLGFEVEPCKSFGFYCEDPLNVLHLRQADLCRHFGASPGDLEDMSLVSRIGMENTIMDFHQRTNAGRTSAVYEQIRNHVGEFGAQLVIVDTLAHTFNGNENIRVQVTSFVAALQRIATEIDGAVVLNSHPSVASMASGTGYSGSTAWKATVRAHMYLKRPKGYDDEADDADNDQRVIKTMKANWGPGGGVKRLRWADGVFVAEAPERLPVHGVVERLSIDNVILAAVKYVYANNDKIAAGRQANNNIARVIGKLPSCRHLTAPDIFAATDRLLDKERLVRVTVGRTGKQTILLMRSEDAPSQDDAGEVPNE